MKKAMALLLSLGILFLACKNSKKDGEKAIRPTAFDTNEAMPQMDDTATITTNLNNQILQKMKEVKEKRKEVYNKLSLVKKDIPDLVRAAKNQDERNYINDIDFEVEIAQQKLLNAIDKINIDVLQVRATAIEGVIKTYGDKVKKLDAFTNTLKDITFGLNALIKAGTFLIDKGIIVPASTPDAL